MVPFQHRCCWRVTQVHHEAGMGSQHGFVTWIRWDNRTQLMLSKNKASLFPARLGRHARLERLQCHNMSLPLRRYQECQTLSMSSEQPKDISWCAQENPVLWATSDQISSGNMDLGPALLIHWTPFYPDEFSLMIPCKPLSREFHGPSRPPFSQAGWVLIHKPC